MSDSQKRIKELTQQISAIENQIQLLTDRSWKWAEKRDLVNRKVRERKKGTFDLKRRRDTLNTKVKKLKETRGILGEEYAEKASQIMDLKNKLKESREDESHKSTKGLEADLYKIEWKIQTESISLIEENKLVEQVKKLSSQLLKRREIEKAQKDILTLINENKDLQGKRQSCHEIMMKNAEQSQILHQNCLERWREINEMEIKADNLHENYAKTINEVRPLDLELGELKHQLAIHRNNLKNKEEKEKTERLTKLREELKQKALRKLRNHERLSLDEFMLLEDEET